MRLLIFIISLAYSLSLHAMETRGVDTPAGEVSYEHYAASGDRLFIWIAPEAGLQDSERQAANKLAQSGVEVWYPNLFDANFLPVVQSSMDQFPAEQLAGLLSTALKTNKRVYFVTSGRGVIPVLRGVRQWQTDNPNAEGFHGLVVLSAKLFVETPDPGKAAELMPITKSSNLPIYWLQPDKSPWWWKLATTKPALEEGGSDVFTHRLKGVRDRFYYRPDATPYESKLATSLPSLLTRAARMLDTQGHRRVAVKTKIKQRNSAEGKKDRVLNVYLGNPQPPPLSLKGMDGLLHSLDEFKGQVVLVNFWATWCPPCVHEMPSMQRLQDSYKGKAFTILGINMAEDRQTIHKFLNEKVSVNFPIWLDSDGKALRDWQVFAFPTSYVIDKKGRVRYALFGSREWDQPDITSVINDLLRE